MPTVAEQEVTLVDTSAAVALVLEDHRDHTETRRGLSGATLGLCGYAAFETYSVLTRLPAPARRTPGAAMRLIERNFPATCFLPEDESARLLAQLGALGVTGGSVYDALVGACARAHRRPLASRDRRALEVYLSLGVELRPIGSSS